MRTNATVLVLLLAVAAWGCGGGDHGAMMTGPSGMSGAQANGAALMSVSPAGGSTGAATSTTITLQFSAPMAVGMEQYMDLHMGDLSGPTVPMSCAWSADRSTLTCTPSTPLSPRTTYVIHLGGGAATQAGAAIDFGRYGPMMGGQWIMGGMMGASHAGQPWGMMGSGWHGSNGSYGMAFPFTTA